MFKGPSFFNIIDRLFILFLPNKPVVLTTTTTTIIIISTIYYIRPTNISVRGLIDFRFLISHFCSANTCNISYTFILNIGVFKVHLDMEIELTTLSYLVLVMYISSSNSKLNVHFGSHLVTIFILTRLKIMYCFTSTA